MRYLLVDVGSTYTKLNLLDTEKIEVIGSSQSYTTVNSDVRVGFYKALEKLKAKCKLEYDEFLGCSSASGGLKVVVVGFSKNLTTYACKTASLSSGARILKEYYYELTSKDLDEIENLKPDILLLCGGINGGNTYNIIFNAKAIAKKNYSFPVVCCGNESANNCIRDIFDKSNIRYVFTENVMPTTNVVNYIPLRKVIAEIFISTITKAKGIDALSKKCKIFLPTPIAVQNAISTYGKVNNISLLSIDIGGATTDIHSIGKSYWGDENIIAPEIDEPYEKRTVEGDMGMRYSATALYESLGDQVFKNLGYTDAKKRCQERFDNTDFIPTDLEEEKFDQILGYLAAKTALSRHIGKLKKIPTSTRYIYKQSGKDLRRAKEFLATGGVLINSKNPSLILKSINDLDDSYLKPENPKFLLDKSYILSSVGLISKFEPEKAVKFLKKYLKEI